MRRGSDIGNGAVIRDIVADLRRLIFLEQANRTEIDDRLRQRILNLEHRVRELEEWTSAPAASLMAVDTSEDE